MPPSISDFDTIARHYDLLYAQRVDDLDMWLDLTEDVAGSVLEVGCGTGRVMLPLLQSGRRMCGLDISEVALASARAKIEAGGFEQTATLHLADMRTFDLPQKDFAFAFIPINTFMHCLSTDDQLATLRSIHRHLQADGTLVVDLYHPNPQALLEADGRMVLVNQQVDDLTGHTIQWFAIRQLQLEAQTQDVTFILDEITSAGNLRRDTFSFQMRYVHRFEMELLLQAAGFDVEIIFGDYDMSLFYDESPRIILVARKN